MAEKRRKEIYTYQAPWPVYGLASSQRAGAEFAFRFAVGSFVEEYSNKVQIIQLDDDRGEFVVKSVFDHPYPTTKILWAPEAAGAAGKDLLATSGDYLRLWNVGADGEVRSEAVFNNNKNSEYCAPVTSFDWNPADANVIATSSIDTTCTIWDVGTRKVRTQLIAHDREVFDVSWSGRNKDVFATVGADGSLRLFDLRSLEHSTIIYESGGPPLLRLAWNKLDNNYLATFAADASRTVVLDVRMPSLAVAELPGHSAGVNAVAWAPHSACHICTAGDDFQALIWDLSPLPKAIEDPILAYTAEEEINAMVWSAACPDWVSVAWGRSVQMLRV